MDKDNKKKAVTVGEYRKVRKYPTEVEYLEEEKEGVTDLIKSIAKASKHLFPLDLLKHPHLRFKDDNGETYPDWVENTLREIVSFAKAGGTPLSTKESFYNGDVPFLSINDMTQQGKSISSTSKTLTELGLKNSTAWKVPAGSLIYAMYASVGKVAINKEVLATSQALMAMNFKPTVAILDYVYYYLSYHKETLLRKYITTGTQPNINAKTLLNFVVPLPSLPEQEKIANFLSLLDEQIENQETKISLLSEQKKGYVQRIFSQKLRFKDDNGENYPDWEEKTLREIVSFAKAGGTPLSTEESFYNGDVPFLSISDMTQQGKNVSSTSKTLTELGIKNSTAWKVPAGSLIYAMYASVGKVAINKEVLATSQALMAMNFKPTVAILDYVYYYLSYHTETLLQKYITTGTQPNINAKTLLNFDVPLPSFSEQEKIANFLSLLDEQIENNKLRVDLLKEQKKGYIQRLF